MREKNASYTSLFKLAICKMQFSPNPWRFCHKPYLMPSKNNSHSLNISWVIQFSALLCSHWPLLKRMQSKTKNVENENDKCQKKSVNINPNEHNDDLLAYCKCRTPLHESFSFLRPLSSATLPICCVICTGYLFSTVYSLN